MISFPNPLHPATVHFPIAFLLLGAAHGVVQAAHLGGQLVYRHGAGVTVGKPATADAPLESPRESDRGGDERDEEQGE